MTAFLRAKTTILVLVSSFSTSKTYGLVCESLFGSVRSVPSHVSAVSGQNGGMFSLKILALQKKIREHAHESELDIRKIDSGRSGREQWVTLDANVMVALSIAVITKTSAALQQLQTALKSSTQFSYLAEKEIQLVARHCVSVSTESNLSGARQFLYRSLHGRGAIQSKTVTALLDSIYQHSSQQSHARYAIEKLQAAARVADDLRTKPQLEKEIATLPRQTQELAGLSDTTLQSVLAFSKEGRAKAEVDFRAFLETDPFFSDFSAYSKNVVIFLFEREVAPDAARMILLKRKAITNPALDRLIQRYEALLQAQRYF